MNKLKVKIYLTVALFLIISCIVLLGGYLHLSKYYVDKTASNSFINMTKEVATEFDVKINSYFNSFKSAVDSSDKQNIDDIYQDVLSSVDDINIHHIDNINIGYIDVVNNQYYLNNQYYQYGNQYIEEVFNQKITFGNFSYVLKNYDDNNNYIILRYQDIILYFDASSFANLIFDSFLNNDKTDYFVIDKNGRILYEKNNDYYFNKLYTKFDFFSKETAKYDNFIDDLKNVNSGCGVFASNNGDIMVLYNPLVSEYNNTNLFIFYSVEYELVKSNSVFIATQKQLRNSLLVIFISLFLAINIVLLLATIIYSKKEYEFSLSRINQVFVKPYSLLVNKKGKILLYNKAFKKSVNDASSFTDVNDFVLYNNTNEPLKLIRNQEPFVIMIDSDSGTEYVRFIPIKKGSKYSLIGYNETEEVLDNNFNRQVALYNIVTKLPNRYLLDRALNDLFASKEVYNTNNAVIAIDINDFAKINRILGYSAADNVLCELRDILIESLREFEAQLFNIRTSLFVVLIKNVYNFNAISDWSKKCLQSLQDPINVKGNFLTSIDLRMGIYNIEPSNAANINGTIIYDSTMAALERAKVSRLTKCAFYNTELGQMYTRDQVMEEDLRKAIEKKEFVMFYQPQYNTKTKRVVGFEALVRWDNPKYRLESVEHFINLAEKNGMIVDIGRIIIEETFKFAKEIQEYGIHISLNVSPVQLLQNGFVNELIEMFNHYELNKGTIAVEITETFLMENSDTMIEKIKLLRNSGFSIHLDDFGIGYSSMLYLKDLPIDLIKIDKQFIKEMMNDNYARTIVTKVIQIATSLNLGVIAEGVETDKQSEILSKKGCNIIQGYLISKAINKEEALEFTKKRSKKITEIIVEKEQSIDEYLSDDNDDEIEDMEEDE